MKEMEYIYVFSDASCNPLKDKSIGCYTFIRNDLSVLNLDIQIHQMDFSSSTLAELNTIKVALEYSHNKIKELLLFTGKEKEDIEITLYTDCKNFVDLITKRKDNDKIKAHRNYEFYKELIDLIAVYKTNVCWIKGHDKKYNKISQSQKVFSILDKKARQLSREII